MKQLSTDRPPTEVSDFDRTTALTPLDESAGGFLVELDTGWSSLVGIHGGYLCAIAARAAESVVPDRPVRTLSTSFLRTAQPGPARVSVEMVRVGRSVATVVVDLVQDDRRLLTSRITSMVPGSGPEWEDSRPAATLPPPEDCVAFVPEGPVRHFARIDARFDPANPPRSGDRAWISGYLRPLEGRAADPTWLAMASDWFPPPAFALVDPPTGGISVDLVTHIHRSRVVLAPDEWLVGEFEVNTSSAGLAVEHGRITLMDGTPVAESFQTRLTARP